MEIEASTSGGNNVGNVNISTTTFSVNANEEPLEMEELELPETVFRSRHHQLLNSLVTDDGDDYGDIQFFHHHSHIQQQFQFQRQQQQQNDHFLNGDEFERVDASNVNTGSNLNGHHSNTSSIDNPFMDQFFPGRSIEGYLETILEETDEEFEEDGCSVRHWWLADSDTDTDSVKFLGPASSNLRVDSDSQSKSTPKTADKNVSSNVGNQETGIDGGKNTFRTTASSKPFEGHLFDQLDFDFEETLMGLEPRRRCGIVQSSGEQSSRLLAEQPFEKAEKSGASVHRNDLKVQGNVREHGSNFEQQPDNVSYMMKYGNGKCSESPELDDEEIQPAEVNEEDFFYTTSEDSDGSSGENSEATSSDDGEDGKNDGVVLAEFSLNSSMCNRYRRSFEGGSQKFNIVTGGQLKSFRSFDSLNQLLFSKADTFPSFHYIKEVTEPSPSSEVEVEGGRDRKNSDSSAGRPTEMSTENLSEDSGIGGDGTGIGSGLNLNLNSPQQTQYNLNSLPSISSANEQSLSFIAKTEFALNPFVFSSASASEENSMNSSLFHAVGGMDGREKEQVDNNIIHGSSSREKEGTSSLSTCTNINNQTVIMKSTPEIKNNDNTQVDQGKECRGTHPSYTIQVPSLQVDSAAEFAQQSSEPDVVAQCTTTTTMSVVEHGSTACGVETKAIEPQAIPPIVVMKEELEGPPPLANNRIGGSDNLTCEYPTPHSEVLLKFMDEDMKMENDFSKSQRMQSESEFVVKEGEEDGANNVDRLAHVITESMANREECMTVSDGMKSGPMSALSSLPTGLTLMTMGLPSLAQNNNNSTTIPSHCKESLLLENLPRTTCTIATARVVHSVVHEQQKHQHQEKQERQLQQQKPSVDGESVCVQTSGWTNVVHHSPTEESVEFISGSSKFGCTRKSVEGNLDPQSGSESLALTEHLCNSTRNGISTSEHNLTTAPTTTTVIEKPGSSHTITSSPRALEGERCASESPSASTSFVPDIKSLKEQDSFSACPSLLSLESSIHPSHMEVMERRSMSPSSSSSPSTIQQPAIKTKAYGPRNEVEVFLVSSRTPSPSMKISTNESSSSGLPETVNSSKVVKKEVHFCPVVSHVSWRESYTDQGSEFSESSDNLFDDQDSFGGDGKMDNARIKTESVTVLEQVTQPIENIVLLLNDNMNGMVMTSPSQNNTESEVKVLSRNNVVENTNGHVYEDVSGNVDLTVSPSQVHHHQPSTLSMVPDLLHFKDHRENVSQSHTHITVKIEENVSPPPPQQQIFPSIFADKNEGKNGNKSKKSSGKSFNIPLGTNGSGGGNVGKKNERDKDKLRFENDINKEEPIAKDNVTNSKSKTSKPGFFERLSKIRLSGTKNKNKKKVHPKENENVVPSNDQSLRNHNNDDSGPTSTATTVESKTTQQQVVKGKSPILKKYPANIPTPVHDIVHSSPSTTNYDTLEDDAEVEKSSEAFEHILDDIAGINVIKLRQQQHGRLLGYNVQPPTPPKIGADGNKVRSFAERKQFFVNLPKSGQEKGDKNPLDAKLEQFKEATTRTRDQISKSHPDLEVIEGVTRDSLSVTIEPSKQDRRHILHHHQQPDSHEKGNRSTSPSQKMTTTDTSSEMGLGTEQKTEREWYRLLKSAAEKYQKNFKDKERNFRTGVVETDLDTGASREMLHLDAEVVELGKVPTVSTAKTRSLTNLSSTPLSLPHGPQELNHLDDENLPPHDLNPRDLSDSDERAKSLEFLLDENHKSSSVPPENKLRLENRQLSEHELRIQRSLQKLNVPEWYKKSVEPSVSNGSNTTKSTSGLQLLKRSEFGSGSALAGRQGGWSAYRSSRESLMSPSSFETLSSLQNNGRYSGSLNRSNFVRGRPATRSSRESLLSPSSTASQSPSAFERCSFTYGMPLHLSRFNSRLSTGSGSGAASISPPSTPVNPVNVGPSYTKKPYLGWRSQEKLDSNVTTNTTNALGSSSGLRLSIYRPPAERLAASRANANSRTSNKPRGNDLPPLPPTRAEKTVLTNKNPELIPCNSPTSNVHDSIREVTQQINQFVHHGDVAGQPPKPKPRQKTGKRPTLWIESSFVG